MFKSILKANNIKLGAFVSQENFNLILNQFSEYNSLEEKIKNQLYQYYLDKIEHKNQSRIKKKEKCIKKSAQVFKQIGLVPGLNYEEIKSKVEKYNPKFSLLSEEELMKCYQDY